MQDSLGLSTKIVLVVFAAVVATFFVIGLSMQALYEESSVREWRNNALALVALASRQMFDNPDPETIERLSEELGVNIRYTGPEGTYATSDSMPSRQQSLRARRLDRHHHNMPHGFRMFRHHGQFFLAHNAGPRQIIYSRPLNLREEGWVELLLIPIAALAVLALLFGSVIFYIRRKLKPLSTMTEEMESFGSQAVADAGDKDPQADEINRLTASFEKMRRRVEDLLASKETLLRDVSHEFRSPLARMRLALEFIDDEQTKARVNKDIDLLDSLAGELLERAKLTSGSDKPETGPVDLGAVAATAASMVEDGRKKAISLSAPERPVMALANASLLGRCLNNLLANSLRYSRVADGSIQVRVSREGDFGVIEVQDKGRQLEADVVDNLFEPFYRPEESRARHKGGAGLGLAIVASIVNALDGKVESESPESGGLLVRIKLPLAG